jgi:hypothetical protein
VFEWTNSAASLATLRAVLEQQLRPESGIVDGGAGTQQCEGRCPHEEAAELLAACPLASDEQRVEFLAVTTPPFELTKGKKPTAEQLKVLASLKQRRDALFGKLYRNRTGQLYRFHTRL